MATGPCRVCGTINGKPGKGRPPLWCDEHRPRPSSGPKSRLCEWCSTPCRRRFCTPACASRFNGAARRAARVAATPHSRRVDRSANAAGMSEHARRQLLRRWRLQGLPCHYCGKPKADTVDHVVPLVRGGTNYEGNLVPACRSCNSRKQDRLVIEFRLGKVPSATASPWRERVAPVRKPKPVKLTAECYICGRAYLASTRRKTCGGRCSQEHAARAAREAYRAKVGLPPTWHDPAGESRLDLWRRDVVFVSSHGDRA